MDVVTSVDDAVTMDEREIDRARQILEFHVADDGGICGGCYAAHRRLVWAPCEAVRWARAVTLPRLSPHARTARQSDLTT